MSLSFLEQLNQAHRRKLQWKRSLPTYLKAHLGMLIDNGRMRLELGGLIPGSMDCIVDIAQVTLVLP